MIVDFCGQLYQRIKSTFLPSPPLLTYLVIYIFLWTTSTEPWGGLPISLNWKSFLTISKFPLTFFVSNFPTIRCNSQVSAGYTSVRADFIPVSEAYLPYSILYISLTLTSLVSGALYMMMCYYISSKATFWHFDNFAVIYIFFSFHRLTNSDGPIFQCSNVQMFKCSNVPMFKCSNVQIFQFSNVLMIQCSNVQMVKCSNVQMFKHSNVQRFKGSNI